MSHPTNSQLVSPLSIEGKTLQSLPDSIPNRAVLKRRSVGRVRLVCLTVVTGCLGVGIVYWTAIESYWTPTAAMTEGLVFETVKRAPFQLMVTEKGTIDSMRNLTLLSKVEGTTTIINIVPEGSYVKQGDVVCELDSSLLIDKETLQEVLVVKSSALLRQAQEDLLIRKTQNESDVEASELRLQLATLDLEMFVEGTFPQQIAALNAEKTTSEANLTRFTESCIFVRRLVQKGLRNQNDLEAEELNLQDARHKAESARKRFEVLNLFTKKRTESELTANKHEAERNLGRVKRRNVAAMAQFEAEYKSRELTYEVESKKLGRLKKQIEACQIRADQDGQVVYANGRDGRPGDVLIEVGSQVRERQAIINLPDLDSMKVNARIHESRISLIREGLLVKIKIDAYSEDVFHGVVHSVASVPSSTGSYSRDFKEYEAVVKISDDADKVNKLRPGLTATVEVLIERREDVLQIPVQSVLSFGAKQFAFVASVDGDVEQKEISIGQTNDRTIEILTGLTEGEKVVMNPRSHFQKDIEILETVEADRQSQGHESPTLKPNVFPPPSEKVPPTGDHSPSGDQSSVDLAVRFKGLDKNGDGKLAKHEVDEPLLSGFKSADVNGNGTISQEELKRVPLKLQSRLPTAASRSPDDSKSGGL